MDWNKEKHYHNDPRQCSQKSFRKYPKEVGKLCENVFDEDDIKKEDKEENNRYQVNKEPVSFDFKFGGFRQRKLDNIGPKKTYNGVEYNKKLSLKCRSVANYIIEEINKYNKHKSVREKVFLSTKRLQKLIYFCEVEYMKRNNGKPLFDDEYYAWKNGPSIPGLYYLFMQYVDGNINPVYEKGEQELSEDVKIIIDEILYATKNLDTVDLTNISNVSGSPYDKVFNEDDEHHEQLIFKKDICNYYVNKNLMLQLKNNDLGCLDQDQIIKLKDKTLQLRYMLGGLYLHGGMVECNKYWECDARCSTYCVPDDKNLRRVKDFMSKHHISNETFIRLTRSYLFGTINPYKCEWGDLIPELDRVIMGYNFVHTNNESYPENDLKEYELMDLIMREARVEGTSLNVFLKKYSLTAIDFMILAKTSLNYKFKMVRGFEKNDLFKDLDEILTINDLRMSCDYVITYRNMCHSINKKQDKPKSLIRKIYDKIKK